MNCSATVKSTGEPCKGQAVKDGLCIAHTPRVKAEVQAEAPPVVVSPKPAKLKNVRRARNLRVGLRALTMLRPICHDGCLDGVEVPHDWYLTCPHEPYVGKLQKTESVPIYSEPREDDSVVLEQVEERIRWEVWPNFCEAMVAMKANSGRGVEKGRNKGWILPEELRTPAFPNGIAPMCQFRSCQWQEGLVEYKWGTFCRELEARLVGAHATDTDGNQIYGAIPVATEAGRRQAHLEQVAI